MSFISEGLDVGSGIHYSLNIYPIIHLIKFLAHRGLPVGFLLLQYSVLFTVESLSLLYLCLIS